MAPQYPGEAPCPVTLRALLAAANRRALAQRFPQWQSPRRDDDTTVPQAPRTP